MSEQFQFDHPSQCTFELASCSCILCMRLKESIAMGGKTTVRMPDFTADVVGQEEPVYRSLAESLSRARGCSDEAFPVCADLDDDCQDVEDKTACWLHMPECGLCPYLSGRSKA